MKLKKGILLIIIVSIFVSSGAVAQSHYVKLSGGVISNPAAFFKEENNLIFYPELDLGGKFFTKGLQWELGLGYWDEGITEPLPISDGGTFNYSGFIAALRFKLIPRGFDPEFNVPLRVIGGISYHYIDATEVWGDGPHILSKTDYVVEVFYYDAGLELYFPVFNYFILSPKFLVFIPVKKSERIISDYKYSFSLGMEYAF